MNLQVKSGDLPPFKPFPQKPPSIAVTRKPDGTIYIRSLYPLGNMHRSIAHLLEERAGRHPERNFIGERTPLAGGKLGDWRYTTYGNTNNRASSIAQSLLNRGLTAETPLMVLSGNSIAHAAMMLGANNSVSDEATASRTVRSRTKFTYASTAKRVAGRMASARSTI